MIVEDQFLIAKQLEFILWKCGHDVVGIVDTLADAETLARDTKPDLAMVDLSLADGVSGTQVAEMLSQTTDTKVVFVTANSRRLAGKFHGALGCVEKPFTQSAVTAAATYLTALLNGKAGGLPAPSSLTLSPEYRC